jgi:hypothetical protein
MRLSHIHEYEHKKLVEIPASHPINARNSQGHLKKNPTDSVIITSLGGQQWTTRPHKTTWSAERAQKFDKSMQDRLANVADPVAAAANTPPKTIEVCHIAYTSRTKLGISIDGTYGPVFDEQKHDNPLDDIKDTFRNPLNWWETTGGMSIGKLEPVHIGRCYIVGFRYDVPLEAFHEGIKPTYILLFTTAGVFKGKITSGKDIQDGEGHAIQATF